MSCHFRVGRWESLQINIRHTFPFLCSTLLFFTYTVPSFKTKQKRPWTKGRAKHKHMYHYTILQSPLKPKPPSIIRSIVLIYWTQTLLWETLAFKKPSSHNKLNIRPLWRTRDLGQNVFFFYVVMLWFKLNLQHAYKIIIVRSNIGKFEYKTKHTPHHSSCDQVFIGYKQCGVSYSKKVNNY